jgi:hypothetical protein
MSEVGFLDGEELDRSIHDWEEHNPWASGSKARSEKARWAALCMRHGSKEAANLMPEYASSKLAASSTLSSNELVAQRLAQNSSAPSLSPSPSLSPKATSPNGEESAAASPAADPCPHAEIIAAYHELLPELARVRTWDADRQKILRARWREDRERQSVAWWRSYFEYVRRCPFLLGQESSGHRDPFLADLEWLIRPRNFRKVIEGKYESRRVA